MNVHSPLQTGPFLGFQQDEVPSSYQTLGKNLQAQNLWVTTAQENVTVVQHRSSLTNPDKKRNYLLTRSLTYAK